MAITAADRSVLTWLVVHAVVVGWMFGGSWFHVTSKGEELSYKLYCAIFSGRGYYRGNIRISWKYPYSVDIIRI